MNNLRDLTKYRQSKILYKDLLHIVALLHQSINNLEQYAKYTNIQGCIATLQFNKTLLEIQLNKHAKVLKDHGKVE